MSTSIDMRTALALGVTIVAVLGIVFLSWAVIASTDTGVNERAMNVLNAVLPLFGAWIGTVLAYYFSRENFESATNSVQRLYRDLNPEAKPRSVGKD